MPLVCSRKFDTLLVPDIKSRNSANYILHTENNLIYRVVKNNWPDTLSWPFWTHLNEKGKTIKAKPVKYLQKLSQQWFSIGTLVSPTESKIRIFFSCFFFTLTRRKILKTSCIWRKPPNIFPILRMKLSKKVEIYKY